MLGHAPLKARADLAADDHSGDRIDDEIPRDRVDAPSAIKPEIWVNDAEATVTITMKTDVAAATGTGTRLRFTNCGMMTATTSISAA